MLRLIKFLHQEMSAVAARIVAALLAAGLARGVLLALFNAGAAAAITGTISWVLPAIFVAVLLLYLLASQQGIHHSVRAVEDMRERVRVRLAGKLLFAQLRFLEQRGTGEIYTQLGSDLQKLRDAAMTFLNALQAAVLVLFSLGYIAWLSVPVFIATLLTGGAGAMLYFWLDKDMRHRISHARNRENALFDALGDTLRGFKELKLSRAKQRDHQLFIARLAREFRDLWVKSESQYQLINIVSQSFLFLLIAIVAFVLPLLTPSSGIITFQTVAAILFMMTPLETLLQAIPSLAKARASLDSIEALETHLDHSNAPETILPPPDFESLTFRNVHFRYDGGSSTDHFDVGPLDLEIKRGEMIFVIGGNGAGKTTFLKLLTGLYSPSSGDILLNDQALHQLGLQNYREYFAAVFSDFHLFSQLYGLDAKDHAALHDLLGDLAIAHKTRVTEGALSTIDLSTGQRKRLAYALNRLLDRQIYIFDEFAADQDPEFRAYFYAELLPRLKRDGKTVIAVTHDDRYFGTADRVVKLDYGHMQSGA